MIYKAVREKHPEITVVGTVGPFYEGTDYAEAGALPRKWACPWWTNTITWIRAG